jgi:hypothetical protein
MAASLRRGADGPANEKLKLRLTLTAAKQKREQTQRQNGHRGSFFWPQRSQKTQRILSKTQQLKKPRSPE